MEREREREVMLNEPLIHRYFSPRLLVELFVCTTYLTTSIHPSLVRECRLHAGFLSF